MGLLDSYIQDLRRAMDILAGISEKQRRLYSVAFDALGMDASPRDIAPDVLGCMETVSNIIQRAFPELDFPTILSTREGWEYFERSPSFTPVPSEDEDFGLILVYPTGTGNGSLSNGHVFITGKYSGPDGSRWLMSNNSFTGTWEVTGTLKAARNYYHRRGGFPEFWYRCV